MVSAPWLIAVLAPGLDPRFFHTSVTILRISAFSIMAAGSAAINCALLYTDRRFAPFAFYQACSQCLHHRRRRELVARAGSLRIRHRLHVGAWAQLRRRLSVRARASKSQPAALGSALARDSGRPLAVSLYAVSLALNIVFTRAWATHIGPGMAAALDYCMRGVGVPLAFLVSPISNSLLPEIARLRSQLRLREAFRLIDRTLGTGGAGRRRRDAESRWPCANPSSPSCFNAATSRRESTRLVSTVFLGLAPSLIGWSLLELTGRALFALDRPALALGRFVYPGAGQRGPDAVAALLATAVDRPGSVRGIDGGIPGAVRRRASKPQTMGGSDCFLRRLPELDIGMEDLNLAPSGKHLL